MLFKEITILNKDFNIEENMYVGVENDKIEYVGKTRPDKDFGEEYNGSGRLLMPGFYNAHAHSPMALMRGYGENLVLQDWLNTRTNWMETRCTGELCCAWRSLCGLASYPLRICITLYRIWSELWRIAARKPTSLAL